MLATIEGNIGAGKTTLINRLASILDATVLPEPLHARTFATLLERYYADPKRWGMTFQLDTLRARAVAQLSAPEGLVLQDRSVIGDSLFAEVAYEQGFIDDTEYEVYLSLREALTAGLPAPVAVIYLDASPETCLQRIHKRGRGCESEVPLAYLRALHEAHERMARREEARLIRVPWESFGEAEEVAAQLKARIEGLRSESSAEANKNQRRRAHANLNPIITSTV